MSGKIRLKGASSGYVDITAPDSGANTTLNTGRLQEKDSSGDISTGNITTTGYIRGPSTFTIDPANHGDSTGTLRVLGNLTVDGTTTTINSQTVTTADKNIVIAQGAADSAAADGAGITIDTVDASLTYVNSGTGEWNFDRRLIINTDTTGEEYGPAAGGSFGLTIGDAATDSDSICSIKFNSRDAGDNNRHFASIAAQKTGQWADAGGNYPGALTFWTRPTSGNQAERMRIDKDGNVGIGTTSPASKLHVKVATDENIKFLTGGSGDTRISAVNDANSATTQLSIQGDPLLFRTTGGSERMRIDSSGNVGIGATPEAHTSEVTNLNVGTLGNLWNFHSGSNYQTGVLHNLYYDGQFKASQVSAYSMQRFVNSGSTKYWQHYIGDATAADSAITFSDPSYGVDSTGALIINGNGLVIGTTPSASGYRTKAATGLTMRGGTSDGLLGVQDGNGRMQLKWNATSGTSEKYLVSSEKAFFWDMTITSSPIWEMKYGAGGTADSAISWSVLLDLTSSGDLEATGDVIAYSDERLKENIEIIPNALEKIEAIDGVTFTRKDESEDFIGRRRAGVIAQQVEKVLPEVVTENKEGTKQVAYGNMVGLLVEAIKELKAEIEELKK